MLKRYWLILYPENRFGPGNIGVTAFTPDHAKTIAKKTVLGIGWKHVTQTLIDKAEVVENIDVTTLDKNHVRPNMGVVSWEGVWWPNLNS